MKKRIILIAIMLFVITSMLFLVSCDDEEESVPSTDSSTQGLAYQAYPDKGYAALTGFATWMTETDIIIASTYNGLPVTTIESEVFHNCETIKTVTIPASVTSIGDSAFCGSGLASVTFAEGSQLVSIDKSAFSHCENLTSIEIPDSVTSIGDYAFSDCGFESFLLPSALSNINSSTFSGCVKLRSVEIPANIASIGDFAFSGCNMMTSVSFAKNSQLVTIGDQAFYQCHSLKSITIPKSVSVIGHWAFSGCDAVESITVEGGNSSYHSVDNCLIATASETLRLACKNSIIPADDSVTRIADDALGTCGHLYDLMIPANITSIADSAFGSCSKLVQITNLSNIDLTQYRLSLPQNPGREIRTSVQTAFSNVLHTDADGYVSYQVNDTLYFMGYTGNSSAIDLSSKGFDAIYKCALYERKDIKSITISTSVKSIGNHAFWDCTGLTSVEIPASITSIGEWAFGTCDNLSSAVFVVPDGWWRETYNTSVGISASDLANPTTAAKYLTDIYSQNCYRGEWKRN